MTRQTVFSEDTEPSKGEGMHKGHVHLSLFQSLANLP